MSQPKIKNLVKIDKLTYHIIPPNISPSFRYYKFLCISFLTKNNHNCVHSKDIAET